MHPTTRPDTRSCAGPATGPKAPLRPVGPGRRRLHTLAAGLALAGALLASGCGPGVGGTGTGGAAPPLADFGAAAQPVCASDLAAVLACTTTGALANAGTALGSCLHAARNQPEPGGDYAAVLALLLAQGAPRPEPDDLPPALRAVLQASPVV